MSIYEKGSALPKISFAWVAKVPKPILWAVLIILLLLAGYIFFTLFPYALTKTISFSFDKNPINAEEQVLLSVTITNTTGTTANNVDVKVEAVDSKSFSVDKPSQRIEVLDRSRKLSFLVNPVGAVKPGEYEFSISTTINGKPFSENAVLTVAEK
jgi:hypothetical protein